MIRRRTFIRTIIVEAIFFGILHALISILIYAFFADLWPVIFTTVLLVPYFCMYKARRAESILIFLGAHILLIIWPLFLPVIWTPRAEIFAQLPNAPLSSMLAGIPRQSIAPLRIGWFVILLLSAIRSVSLRLRGPQRYDSGYLLFCVGFLTALSLIAGYFGMTAIVTLNALWAFYMIAGYLIYSQSARIDESLEILSVAGKKPVTAIIRFNNNILAVFLIPVALFALVSPWLPLERVTRLLGESALAALRGLFKLIDWIMSLFRKEQQPIAEETPPMEQGMGGFMGEAAETPAWLALLDAIIRALMQILLVAGIAAALAYAAYRFYRRFLATRGSSEKNIEDDDTSEYIGPKLAARPVAEAIAGLLRRLGPKTEKEKIRRAYFKKVRRHIQRGAAVRQSDTAGEIAVIIRPLEDIDDLTSLYEGARYGK